MTVVHTKGVYVDDICYLCGRKIDFTVKLKCPYSYHRDHVVSVKELGAERADLPLVDKTYGDVWRAAHQLCNLKKNANSVEHFNKNLRLDALSTLASHVHTLADCGVDGGLGESFTKSDEMFIHNLDELQRFYRAKSIWALFHAIEENPRMSSYIALPEGNDAVTTMTSMLERGLLNAARTHAKMDLLIPPAETIEDFLDQMYVAGGMVGTVITSAEIVSRVWDVLPTRSDYTQRFVELATVSGEFYMIRLRDGLEAGESLRDMMDRAYICVDEPEYRDYLYATLGQFILPGHVLMTDEVESMKFDVVIGNPPYNIGTNKNAYIPWFELAAKINPTHTIFICATSWMVNDNTASVRELMARGLHTVIDSPNARMGWFKDVKTSAAITYQQRGYTGPVSWSSRMIPSRTASKQEEFTAIREVIGLGREPWIRTPAKYKKTLPVDIKFMSEIPDRKKLTMQYGVVGSARFAPFVSSNKYGAPFRLAILGEEVRKNMSQSGDDLLVAEDGTIGGTAMLHFESDSFEEAENFLSYMNTRAVSVAWGERITNMHVSRKTMNFVVQPDVSHTWSEESAAALYGWTLDQVTEMYAEGYAIDARH